MPGLVGYVQKNDVSRPSQKIEAMAHALEPDDRFRRELFEGDGFGLGRVSLGILNPQPQPIWNADRSLGIIMEGEFYNPGELKQDLLNRGRTLETSSDAELALNLYEVYGEAFAERLNGAFVLVLWDSQNRLLLAANDRLGLYPLYYAETGQSLVFASGVRALLADASLARDLDRVAIAELLTFDHVLDDRTLLAAVKLLPQASLLTYSRGTLKIRPYWTLHYAEYHEQRNEDEDVKRLDHLLMQAVARQSQGDLPIGLLLSGGLDSRMLLALLVETLGAKQLQTFTWGIPGCDDARAAKELAAIAGTQHRFYELRPDWLLAQAEEAVRLTDGLGNLVNLHALANAAQESQHAKVFFKGFLGDAMFGFAVNRYFWANYDDETAFKVHVAAHHYHGVITFDKPEHASLFTDDFNRTVGDAVFESYRAGMKASQASQLATQRLYFDLTQRVPRMTINGVEVARSFAAVRLPFADYDLIDFSTVIPPGYHYERYLAHRAFNERYPQFAKVPNPSTGLPMISCAREIMLRARKDLQWHLRARGLNRLAGPERRPYKDYNTWFRTVLRAWVEETLLSQRTLERGIFQPEAVRKQVSEHMAGANRAVRLGALLSLELWLRRFLD